MKHKNVKQINIFVKSLHLVVSLENFKKVRITLIVYFSSWTSCLICKSHMLSTPVSRRSDLILQSLQNRESATRVSSARYINYIITVA